MDSRFQVMPPLSVEEYEALRADVAENGVLVPVVEDGEGNVIDGHHRIRAWRELVEEGRDVADYPREVRSDLQTVAEKRELALLLNMNRRHLNQAQKRQMVAAKLKESPKWSDNRIAKLLAVSWVTVRGVRDELEATSQIKKFAFLVGSDGKERPRSDARTEEEKERVRESNELGRIFDLRKTIFLDSERTDEEIAEKTGFGEEAVTEQRKIVEDAVEEEAPRKGFNLLYQGLTALRRATGYRREPKDPIRAYLRAHFLPRVEIEPVIDLEEIADEMARQYVRDEAMGRRLDGYLFDREADRLRDRVRADREAVDLLAEFVSVLGRKVEERIELAQRLHEDEARLEEDLKRFEEGEEE